MKLRHFAVFGGIFTVIICLLLFLFIVTADDEESGSSSLDFSGLNLSQEVLKHQPTVEKYAKEYGISDYVNYLFAIMQVESGGTGTTDVMQASESLGLPLNSLSVEDSIKQGCKYFSELLKSAEAKGCDINTVYSPITMAAASLIMWQNTERSTPLSWRSASQRINPAVLKSPIRMRFP